MVSAVDIITYIGIPLAVLGVLPTIYTCLKSYFTLRAITRTLQQNGVTAITRSSLLSGIVEIEIPRRSLIPLERSDPQYFALHEGYSGLKGGSWTKFYWKEMVIGVKSYRLQYHDELAQPQAEVGFESLVAFLLDRGAVPRKEGWADLRSAGLWTPAGTKLLVSPRSNKEVLWVALSDDSDGILSLSVNWSAEWDRRREGSLPPYWVKLCPPAKEDDVLKKENEEADRSETEKEEKDVDGKGGFLDDDSVEGEVMKECAVSLKISATGIHEAYNDADAKKKLPLLHLRSEPSFAGSLAGFWFCSAVTAFVAPQGGLWAFTIPEDVVAMTRQESIPCGVMVLLGVMTDDEVPVWRTPHDAQAEQFEKHVKFAERSRQALDEMRLPPTQREAARLKRLQAEAHDFHNEFRRKMMRDQQHKEAEVVEAMQSQKLPISLVADANRRWLIRKYSLSKGISTGALAEQVLFGMVQDRRFAQRVAAMLDCWKSWSQSGGMTKSHYLAAKEDQVAFALASFLLVTIRHTVNEPTGSVVGDLQDCLRIWTKVRLG